MNARWGCKQKRNAAEAQTNVRCGGGHEETRGEGGDKMPVFLTVLCTAAVIVTALRWIDAQYKALRRANEINDYQNKRNQL